MAINSLNSSILRLSGVSSGLDTESIVQSMLQLSLAKVNKQNQITTKLEWKANSLREVNSLMRTFRESNLSVLNASSNMLSSAAYNTYTVNMLSSTNAVNVSAGSSANTGTLTINKISQLAEAASMKSASVISGDSISMNTALKDLALNNVFEFDEGEISFSINGETFTFTEDTLLGDVINSVNASDAGVKMTYSSLTKGFAITAKTTGSASVVDIQNIKGNAFAAQDSAFGIAEGTKNGENAILFIEDVEVSRSSNSFTIDGITYSLKAKTEDAVSFSVEQNLDATVNKVAAFIDSYNTLIGKLQSLVDEKTYRAYSPLTDDQKAAMTETEIKTWEDYAKSGLLRNDSKISSLLSTLRSAFYSAVEGTGLSPSDIGLSTGSYYEKGKITVDKDKLRTALESNPDAVNNLFVKISSSEDTAEAFANSGLVVRISNALLNYTKQATSDTLTFIDKQISDSKGRAVALSDQMSTKETALWKRFTAMETALATLNSQSSWLSTLTSSWNSK